MNINLKENKGITLTDTIIAIATFIIFTSLVITISYNIYLQSNFIKRNSTATNYIVELFEYARALDFEEVTIEMLNDYIRNKEEEINLKVQEYSQEGESNEKGYQVTIDVTDNPNGYIKQIDMTIEYKLGKKTKSVNMSTLISK